MSIRVAIIDDDRVLLDSLSRIILESKEDMRKRGARSPDEWDAVALTFAEPVPSERSNFNRPLDYQRLSIA